MEITTVPYKRCDVVKAVGRIDKHHASDLEKAFNDILEGGKVGIVFDMSEVSFISDIGVWVLLETHKQCMKKMGKLVLTNVADDVLGWSGVQHFIEIYDDVITAVGSFDKD